MASGSPSMTLIVRAMEWYAKNYGFSVPCAESLAVYCLLVAKFMAEASDLVGRDTFVVSHSFNEPARYMPDYFVGFIRAQWEKAGAGKISKLLLRNIPLMMKSQAEIDELIKEAEERAVKKTRAKKTRKKKR